MAELAATGLTPDQMALMMELSASLAAEARPVVDVAAENKRAYDRAYQSERRKNRTTSYESHDTNDTPPAPDKSPPDPQKLTPTPPDVREPRARKADPFPCPDGVDPGHWRDLKANRKAKRLANTPTAHKQILREIAKFTDDEWPPGRIVEFAAAAGWAGIFDPRKNFRTQQNGRSGTDSLRGTRPDPALDMLKRAAAQEAAERGDPAPGGRTWTALPAIGTG